MVCGSDIRSRPRVICFETLAWVDSNYNENVPREMKGSDVILATPGEFQTENEFGAVRHIKYGYLMMVNSVTMGNESVR